MADTNAKLLADRIERAISSVDNIGVHPRKVFAGMPEDWKLILSALRSTQYVHSESTESKLLRAIVTRREWQEADPESLEPWYVHWISELTAQGLHAKADIATVLAILSKRLADGPPCISPLPHSQEKP